MTLKYSTTFAYHNNGKTHILINLKSQFKKKKNQFSRKMKQDNSLIEQLVAHSKQLVFFEECSSIPNLARIKKLGCITDDDFLY